MQNANSFSCFLLKATENSMYETSVLIYIASSNRSFAHNCMHNMFQQQPREIHFWVKCIATPSQVGLQGVLDQNG